MAGLLPEPEVEVAVMGLMLNISGLLYMIPLGLGSATSVRVGNALGAGLPRAARRAARAAAGATTAIQVLLAGSVMASRHVAAHLFTDDPAVVAAAAPVFPVMAFCLLGDGINATLGGMLRGAARQEVGAVLGIVSYWVVGLPLAGVMALKAGWGVGGLWTGLSAAATINVSELLRGARADAARRRVTCRARGLRCESAVRCVGLAGGGDAVHPGADRLGPGGAARGGGRGRVRHAPRPGGGGGGGAGICVEVASSIVMQAAFHSRGGERQRDGASSLLSRVFFPRVCL
jgi:hypothetical protein